ncbi:MAG: hypothetical protein ACLFNY_05820 [Candidatus Aenigmatarchaeota archaeon]
MIKEKDSLKSLDKIKEIDHLLDVEGMDVVKTKPYARYLGDDSYKITDETLCVLAGEYDLFFIHDGVIEEINDLSAEEIVAKIKEYADDKKRMKAK